MSYNTLTKVGEIVCYIALGLVVLWLVYMFITALAYGIARSVLQAKKEEPCNTPKQEKTNASK